MFSIEERIQAQQSVLKNEREVRLILESVPIMIWCAAANGEISYINRHLAEYHGVGLDAVRLDKYFLIHPDDRPGAHDEWRQCVARGEKYSRILRTRRADGAYRWQQVSAEPLRDSEGSVVSWYGMQADVHEAKKSEERLRRLEASLARVTRQSTASQLAASIAHEINQPLAAIVADAKACSHLLSDVPPNLERAISVSTRIARSGQFAAEVVARIRSMFRHAPPDLRASNINEIVEDVLLMLAEELEGGSISTFVDLQSDIPNVLVDRVQMQQVVVNLLHNACESMAGNAVGDRIVSIRSRTSHSGGIEVDIADLGCGVDEPDRIFEPFYSTKPIGMGIGLAICRSVIEAHSGRISVETNTPRGSIFRFSVPKSEGV